jgi:DNA replication protein DnaC
MEKVNQRSFDLQNCVFQKDCIKYNTPECKEPCWRQREFFWLLDNSNLPERHKEDTRLIPSDEDLPVFEYLDYIRTQILDFVDGGNNLLIRGATGTGKSCWSTKLLRQYLMEKSIANGFVKRALFVNIPWFVAEMKHNISNQSIYFKELREDCYTIDLLVLDDIGATSVNSDFIHDELYSIINQRADSGLSTIYTTNLSDEELEENLGARISRRVLGISDEVKIKNTVDLRRPDSEFSFQKFVKESLNGEIK